MGNVRLLFSTGSLYTMDIDFCFEVAHETGFDGIEIMCDHRWSTRNPKKLQQLAAKYDLPVLVLHSPMLHIVPHVHGWDVPMQDVHTVQASVKLAEEIGAETVVMHLPPKIAIAQLRTPRRNIFLPWFMRRHDGRNSAKWIKNDLPAFQENTSVKVAVENIPVYKTWFGKTNPFYWNTVAEWAVSAPYLTMDTTHWATHNINPMDAYQIAKDRIAHIHLSNYQDGKEHRLPQIGELDLGALLKQLNTDGFAGTVTCELHLDSCGFPNEERIRQNLHETVSFCRAHLT